MTIDSDDGLSTHRMREAAAKDAAMQPIDWSVLPAGAQRDVVTAPSGCSLASRWARSTARAWS
ncbi:hypothetical protein [Microbacterium elymi]|uniref:Uncharacterized protein n=1 Tax=Microbacterium elymi TaxID=2909587 RepID=A0ABY5NH54_9MICO|nr:hypothetical protein [Microbacterium elymi]UUT34464.1 hypothetical protein L2X98_28205 [Microbacterium elymi]